VCGDLRVVQRVAEWVEEVMEDIVCICGVAQKRFV
jgi:hypothetical protein